MDNVILKPTYGSVELHEAMQFKDGVFYLGGYSIHRDESGYEISRTEFQPGVRLNNG